MALSDADRSVCTAIEQERDRLVALATDLIAFDTTARESKIRTRPGRRARIDRQGPGGGGDVLLRGQDVSPRTVLSAGVSMTSVPAETANPTWRRA